MTGENIRLSSSEIAGLWETYMQESMAYCILIHLAQHLKDEEIKPLVEKSLELAKSHIKQIETIFNEEKFPIPDAFSDEDVDLTAPPLFHDEFSLSFIYSMNRMAMVKFAFTTSNVARTDVRKFFTDCLNESTNSFNKAVTLMLNKGIYERPPMINYPEKVEYIESESLFTGYLNKKRKINVLEINEIFYNIVRNYYGSLLCLGLLQVSRDEEVKKYIKNGKKICDKQIEIFNEILLKEDLLGAVPLAVVVTDSTTSPFSDRLIVQLFHSLNQMDITLLGHSLSLSMRSDLTLHFSQLIFEVIQYSKDGFDILVNRKWLEQPPQATDRKKLMDQK